MKLKSLFPLLAALALTILGSTVVAEEKGKPLIVGMELAYPPFEMTDTSGKPTGVSVDLATDLAGTVRFLEGCELITLGESLGGVESLIEHPAIMTHASIPPELRAQIGITDSLVRFSVGVEDVADLRRDLERAFERI